MKTYLLLSIIIILSIVVFSDWGGNGFIIGGQSKCPEGQINVGSNICIEDQDCKDAVCSQYDGVNSNNMDDFNSNRQKCIKSTTCEFCDADNVCYKKEDYAKQCKSQNYTCNGNLNCIKDDSGQFISKYDCEIYKYKDMCGEEPKVYECASPALQQCIAVAKKDHPGGSYEDRKTCESNCKIPPATDCSGSYIKCNASCIKEWKFNNENNKSKCPKKPNLPCYYGDGDCKEQERKKQYICNGTTGTCEVNTKRYGNLSESNCNDSCTKCSTITDPTNCTNYDGTTNCYWCKINNKCMVADLPYLTKNCSGLLKKGTNINNNDYPTYCTKDSDCSSDGACDNVLNRCVYKCSNTCNYLGGDEVVTFKSIENWKPPEKLDTTTCVKYLENSESICPFGHISCDNANEIDPKCRHRLCDPKNSNCNKVNGELTTNLNTCDSSKECPWIGYSKNPQNILNSTADQTTWCDSSSGAP